MYNSELITLSDAAVKPTDLCHDDEVICCLFDNSMSCLCGATHRWRLVVSNLVKNPE